MGPSGDDDNDDDSDDDVLDIAGLVADRDGVVDGGVTSGADPSSWDPIEVDGNP